MLKKTPILLPPVWLLLTVGLMVLAHVYLPVRAFDVGWLDIPGAVLAVFGLLMISWSALGFFQAGTHLVPFQEATALVTGGFYRFTRNPMYLGMVLMLVGGAFVAGSVGVLVPIPLFVLVIHHRFILAEERFMEQAFGDEYLTYKTRVRRWL